MAIQRNQISNLLNNITSVNRKYWEEFKQTLKPSTAKIYQSDIINAMFYINKDITEITAQDFEKYIEYNQQQGVNAKAINRKISATSAIINYLMGKGIMTDNPLTVIKRLDDKEVIYEKIDLTWEQIQQAKKLKDIKWQIFDCVYNKGLTIEQIEKELDITVSKIQYQIKALGQAINAEGLKYQDIQQARNKFFTTCPKCGNMQEMTEGNWQFKDCLLICKDC